MPPIITLRSKFAHSLDLVERGRILRVLRRGPGAPEPKSLVTFRLEPSDGGTVLTLTHEHLPDEEARKSQEQGWIGLLDKLPIFLGCAE